MYSNTLKLNKDKTEFIVFSPKQHVKKTENPRIKVGFSYINYSMSVNNLGLILNNTLGMENQVNSICKSCYYQIRNIGLIRKYINDETFKTLVQAHNISRLLFHTFKVTSRTTLLYLSDLIQKYIPVRML